MENDKVAWTN